MGRLKETLMNEETHDNYNSIITLFSGNVNKYRVVVDDVAFNAKPTNGEHKLLCERTTGTRRYVSEMTLQELLAKIAEGHTVIPCIAGRQKDKDFESQQIFMVDIDNKETILTVDEAISLYASHDLPVAFHYETFNSTADTPKYRLGFTTTVPLTDLDERNNVAKALIAIAEGYSDPMCDNTNRVFYGTKNPNYKIYDNGNINVSVLLEWYKEYSNNVIAQKQAARCIQQTTFANKQYINDELQELKSNYDLLQLMCATNEPSNDNGNIIYFRRQCSICGHNDDLRYYRNTNTFFCYSSGKGGDVLDYIMLNDKCDFPKAKEKLFTLCGKTLTKPSKTVVHTPVDIAELNIPLVDRIAQIKPEEAYPINDTGVRMLVANIIQDDYRYNAQAEQWFVYNGKHWEQDKLSTIHNAVIEVVNANVIYASTIGEEEVQEKYAKLAFKFTNLTALNTLYKALQSVMPIDYLQLDKDPYVLNCKNGSLNLSTGQFTKHDANDMLAKMCNADYDPHAEYPSLWLKFIDEVTEGNKEKQEYMQRFFGRILVGDSNIENANFLILYGKTTRNGKSTMCDVLANILGTGEHGYAVTADQNLAAIQSKTDPNAPKPSLMALKGKRFVIVPEPDAGQILDIGALKNWTTASGTIRARNLHENGVEFRPTFRIVYDTNHLPVVTDMTFFSSDRVNVVEFNRHFTPEERDYNLKAKLLSPDVRKGILKWLVDGYNRAVAEGMTPPKEVVNATMNYQNRSDKIYNFLSECCERSAFNTKLRDLYDCYKQWCKSTGQGVDKEANFKQLLEAKPTIEIRQARCVGKYDTSKNEPNPQKNAVIGIVINEEWKPTMF